MFAFFIVIVATLMAIPGSDCQHTIIDINWKYDHILILPVGCAWARSIIWRVSLQCPPGSFVVPTRLQASSNRTKFCGMPGDSELPSHLYDGETYSLQKRNPYSDPKQARRYSHEYFANGKLNRHDNPYFPIYNTSTTLWDCVGDRNASVNGCTFSVNASDFREMEVNHASERKDNMSQLLMTLVLPGPYCSTADMFEHYDRFGGVVYKMSRSDGGFYNLGSYNFETPKTKATTTTSTKATTPTLPTSSPVAAMMSGVIVEEMGYGGGDDESLPPGSIEFEGSSSSSTEADFKVKIDKTEVALARNPALHQSEDAYLVIGREKSAPTLSHCLLTLIPRDQNLARILWLKDRETFMSSLLANIHVHFIQVTYNGYSTFYDDMTAMQHSHSWRNMFSVTAFDEATATITLAVNFDLVRTVDQRRVRVGLALYEVLVVGDEHAALLQSNWPYRYMSSSRAMNSRVLLFRKVTVGECVAAGHSGSVVAPSSPEEYGLHPPSSSGGSSSEEPPPIGGVLPGDDDDLGINSKKPPTGINVTLVASGDEKTKRPVTVAPPTPRSADKTVWPIVFPTVGSSTINTAANKATPSTHQPAAPSPSTSTAPWKSPSSDATSTASQPTVVVTMKSTTDGHTVPSVPSPIPAPSTPTSSSSLTQSPPAISSAGPVITSSSVPPESGEVTAGAGGGNTGSGINAGLGIGHASGSGAAADATVIVLASGGETTPGSSAKPINEDNSWGNLLENMWAWWIWAVIGTMVGIVVFATVGAFCFWDQGQSGIRPPQYQDDEDGESSDEPLLLSSFPSNWQLQSIVQPTAQYESDVNMQTLAVHVSNSKIAAENKSSSTTTSSTGLKLLASRALGKAGRRIMTIKRRPMSPQQRIVAATNAKAAAHHHQRHLTPATPNNNGGPLSPQMPLKAVVASLSRYESVGEQKMREFLLFVGES